MPKNEFRVTVEADHIQKLAAGRPIPALAELIWNALDADATRVDVEVDADDFAMRSITVRDDGHGIPASDVESLFGRIGGSWKKLSTHSKVRRRLLHGKEGKGRYKALALGRVAEWEVRYFDDGKLYQYSVILIRDETEKVRISEPKEISASIGTGVDVRISELDKNFLSLETERGRQSLTEIFALYLTDYPDTKVYIENEKLNPNEAIEERDKLELHPISSDEGIFDAEIELIVWKSASERWLFLCGTEGFPYHRITPRFHTPGFQFSAYLKSEYISKLQEQGSLELSEMNSALSSAYEEASDRIKEFFRERERQKARNEVEKWKEENIYPYKSDPKSSVQKAERKVFDIVALKVSNELKEFRDQSARTRAFQLRMLRQAIERGPDELQHILTEVLDLPPASQKELSKLLEEADLANVISASKLVSDRLKFLTALEAILFDSDKKSVLKERTQLHRLLAEGHTWIFGEEYSLTVDDQSLTEVLKKHRKLLGENIVIDEPVRRPDGRAGIVDLMLSRAVPQNRAEDREHLIVELKRPSVKIGAEETTQIKSYAFTVAEDERFLHLNTRWSFWLISNDLETFAKHETRQKGKPPGQVYVSDDGKIEIWIKTWSEVIAEARHRLKFVEKTLSANIDKETSLRYLAKTYDRYLAGVVDFDEQDEAAEVD